MSISFFEYEVPVLQALVELGGSAETTDVYPLVEKAMQRRWRNHPEELGSYERPREVIWRNKVRWAREYLKHKGQLDGSVRGVWTITSAGRERLRVLDSSGRDPDEGKPVVEGIDASAAERNQEPEQFFERAVDIQDHGDILGVKGIVYEPINEQGVVLLFAALCEELGFRIEGIRTGFPDALLARKNAKGTFSKCQAEFEFKASNYQAHKHPLQGCDLIICWVNDWADCPIEVLELKEKVKEYRS